MESTLIILRGNSGSGKTSIARELRLRLTPAILVSQDTIRREIVGTQYLGKSKDTPDDPSIKLIFDICAYARQIGSNIVLEGVLPTSKYRDMLESLLTLYPRHFVYYFNISFDETLRRHQTKPNKHEFGEEAMRSWWKSGDLLRLPEERIINDDEAKDEIVQRVVNDVELFVRKTSDKV